MSENHEHYIYFGPKKVPIACTIVCPKCGGSGTTGPWRGGYCPECGGIGRKGDCPTCKGSGRTGLYGGRECPTCDGNGYIIPKSVRT